MIIDAGRPPVRRLRMTSSMKLITPLLVTITLAISGWVLIKLVAQGEDIAAMKVQLANVAQDVTDLKCSKRISQVALPPPPVLTQTSCLDVPKAN